MLRIKGGVKTMEDERVESLGFNVVLLCLHATVDHEGLSLTFVNFMFILPLKLHSSFASSYLLLSKSMNFIAISILVFVVIF